MTNAQGKDIFSGHGWYLCQVLASTHFPLQDMAQKFCIFLKQWPWTCTNDIRQDNETFSGHKQSLSEVRTSNLSP